MTTDCGSGQLGPDPGSLSAHKHRTEKPYCSVPISTSNLPLVKKLDRARREHGAVHDGTLRFGDARRLSPGRIRDPGPDSLVGRAAPRAVVFGADQLNTVALHVAKQQRPIRCSGRCNCCGRKTGAPVASVF